MGFIFLNPRLTHLPEAALIDNLGRAIDCHDAEGGPLKPFETDGLLHRMVVGTLRRPLAERHARSISRWIGSAKNTAAIIAHRTVADLEGRQHDSYGGSRAPGWI